MSVTTVRSHLASIYSKLDLQDRSDLLVVDEPEPRRQWSLLGWVRRPRLASWQWTASLVLVALPAAALLAALAFTRPGVEHSDPSTTPSPAGSAADEAWDALRARPLLVTTGSADLECPITPSRPLPETGNEATTGAPPITPFVGETVMFSTTTGASNGDEGMAKIRWLATGSVSGDALVRGTRLDAPGTLGWNAEVAHPGELRLSPQAGSRGVIGTEATIAAAGCYTLQVDTSAGSRLSIFSALTYAGPPAAPAVSVDEPRLAVRAGRWVYAGGFADTPLGNQPGAEEHARIRPGIQAATCWPGAHPGACRWPLPIRHANGRFSRRRPSSACRRGHRMGRESSSP